MNKYVIVRIKVFVCCNLKKLLFFIKKRKIMEKNVKILEKSGYLTQYPSEVRL